MACYGKEGAMHYLLGQILKYTSGIHHPFFSPSFHKASYVVLLTLISK
jgi:hypothetical protein